MGPVEASARTLLSMQIRGGSVPWRDLFCRSGSMFGGASPQTQNLPKIAARGKNTGLLLLSEEHVLF